LRYLSIKSANNEDHGADPRLSDPKWRSKTDKGENQMNVRSSHERPGRKAASIFAIVPVAICALAITLTSAAQQAAPTPTAAPSVAGPKVQFKAPTIPALKAGVPTAFNLCTNTPIQVGKSFSDADGLKLDNQQSPCGEKNPSSNSVTGGNPPYSFQWSSGGFPPLGMHLTSNGLLYGTPAPHIGGYPPFKVCAVDMSANEDCREVTMGTQPAAQQAAKHSKTPLLIGVLGGAAVAGVVGARAISSSSSSGDSTEAGTCSGLAPANACGACSCTDNGTCNNPSSQCGGDVCYWAGPGTAAGQAPFCSAK
jgi:hypothetical protein